MILRRSTQPRSYRRMISIYATEVPTIARLKSRKCFIETFVQVWKRTAVTRQNKKNDKEMRFKNELRQSLDTIIQQKKGARAHSPYYAYGPMYTKELCEDGQKQSIDNHKRSSDQCSLAFLRCTSCPPLVSVGDLLSSFQLPLPQSIDGLGMLIGGYISGLPIPSNPISIPKYEANASKRRMMRQEAQPLVTHKETMRIKLDSMVHDRIGFQNINDLNESKQLLIHSIDTKGGLSAGEKAQMKILTKARLNKEYGKRNEKSAIKYYEYVTRKKVSQENKKISRSFNIKHGNVDFTINGRLDGITEDGKIIEIKNRTRKCYDLLHRHEEAQLQTYLTLCDKNDGELVQVLRSGKKNPDGRERQNINITSVQRDEKYFEEYILSHLTVFVTALDVFMGNVDLQKRFLQQPARQEDIIKSLFIHAQALNTDVRK